MDLSTVPSREATFAAHAPSVSVTLRPHDSRCPYWAKIVRASEGLPLPSDVQRSADIPVPFLLRGEEELFPGDLLFEGEANHHRRTDRGWSYWVSYVDAQGQLHQFRSGFGPQKAAAKAQGLPAHLLTGSGDVAGAIRVAHALRSGYKLPHS